MLTSNDSLQVDFLTSSVVAGDLLVSVLDRLAARLDRQWTAPAGYILRRLLLVNYWHFDYEEIVVPHGRLFLLGENGSGKSTILGATIPMLLDGVVRPERLDTFGSTQRKIDHYVLGQRPGGATHQRRTSYVALEFAWRGASPSGDRGASNGASGGNANQPPHLTIGICFAGNADAQETVRPLRFVLTSGRRLGVDLPLKDRQGRVYDANYFRTIVRDNGVITDRQAEYRDLVAHSLFGFADARPLEHLIDVLLLLRRPGLSNELHTFTDVYDYLKRALPRLPEEITRTTTEAFARIDELRHLERRLQRQADACARIFEADLALARARARQRALPVVVADRDARDRRALVATREEALARATRGLAHAQSRHAQIEADFRNARQAIGELEESSLAQSLAELDRSLRRAEAELDLVQQLLDAHEQALDKDQRAADELRARLADHARSWKERYALVRAGLDALARQAAAASWTEGERMIRVLHGDVGHGLADVGSVALEGRGSSVRSPAEVALWLGSDFSSLVADRYRQIEEIAARAAEHERALAKETEARRRHQTRESEVTASGVAWDEAVRALADRWMELARRLSELAPDATLAGLADMAWQPLVSAAVGRDRSELGAAFDAIERIFADRDEAADIEHERLSQEIGLLRSALDDLDRDLARLREEPHWDPPRRPHRERARRALRDHGLDARPLYALVDFAASLEDDRRGKIERMLDDAGLLDALLVRDDDVAAAEALLQTEGLADCRLTVSAAPESAPRLDRVLIVDAAVDERSWRRVTERALSSIALDHQANGAVEGARAELHANGAWSHGLLSGYAGRGGPLGFIGAANRRERWRQELERREMDRGALGERLAGRESDRSALRQERIRRRDLWNGLHQAVDDREFASAEARLEERLAGVRRAETAAREAMADLARCAEECRALVETLSRLASPLLGTAAPTSAQIQTALRAALDAGSTARALVADFERMADLRSEHRRDQARWSEVGDQLRRAETDRDAARQKVVAAVDAARRARERMDSRDVSDFRERLQSTRRRVEQLGEEILRQVELLGSRQAQVEGCQDAVRDASVASVAAEGVRGAALAALTTLLQLNPDVLDGVLIPTDEEVLALAQRGCPLAEVSDETLDRDANQTRERRRAVFDEERGHLVDFDLAIVDDARDRVIANVSTPAEKSLTDLLHLIQGQLRDSQIYLNVEEERLFKDYLFGTGLTAIHRAVQAADELVWRINEILQRTPLGGERYELKLESAADRRDVVTPLARHHALFRRDPAVIADDERRVLLEGVRGAVAEAHRRAAEEGVVFADVLEKVFDYREWYVLNLYVTDGSGQRQRITNRTARARSGAQQLFALYVPLFAALAALYDAAAPWAPRLFAMDEAFDKVSEDNVTLLLWFLVDLGLQWVVASPRLSGAGREVLPACADWQLIHSAATQLAQAIPLIYCDGQLLDGLVTET